MSADAAAPAKKSSKTLILVLLAVLVLGAGGGGAWWFLGRGHASDGEEKPAKASNAKPIFSVLEPFTVNLMDERGERFAQIGVTLEIEDPAIDALIKDRLPAVRNNILMLITSKRMEELITPEGKQQFAAQVQVKAAEALGWEPPAAYDEDDEADAKAKSDEKPAAKRKRRKAAEGTPNPVRRVLFSQFIVQ